MVRFSEQPPINSLDDNDYLLIDVVPITSTSTSRITVQNFFRGQRQITVGSSNADYLIGDYASDYLALQAAIDAVNTNGNGEIIIKSNLSIEAEVTLKNNVTLNLSGTTLTLADSANSKMFTSTNGLTNLTIKDGTIDGNGANQVSGDYLIDLSGGTGELKEILLDNLYIKNSRKHMLFIHGDETGYHRKMIRNCTFENHGVGSIGFGVYIDYAPNTTVQGCTFFDSNGNDVVEVAHLGHVRVDGCWFQNGDINYPFGDNSIFTNNIFLSGRIINDTNTANNVTITNNIILSSNPASGYGAIRVHGANSRIEGNSVYTTQNDGIRVQGGDNHIIANNYVETDGITSNEVGIHAGLSANNVSIRGNVIKNFDIATRLQWDGVSIKDNKAVSCTTGVQLASSASTGHVVANAEIMDNNFSDTTTGFDPTNQTALYGQVKRNLGINPLKQYSIGNIAGGTVTINRLNGDVQTATLTGNVTGLTITGTIKGDTLTLILTQDGTGNKTITWPSNFKKAGGSLTLSAAAGAVDVVQMVYDGTNWREISRALNLS